MAPKNKTAAVDAAPAAPLSASDIAAKLKMASKAKDDAFTEIPAGGSSLPLWEPENEGDSLVGVYLGIEGDKNKTYNFATDKNGSTVELGIRGTHSFRKQFKAVKAGDVVKVVYEGTKEGGGEGDREYRSFKVFRLTA